MTNKYLSLDDLKDYMRVAGENTSDDTELQDAINRAEMQIDLFCGTGFDEQTYSLVQPLTAFGDQGGWLWLTAIERGPVTAVSSVQVLDVSAGATAFTTLTWDSSSGILMPPTQSPPLPTAWQVRIRPNNYAFGLRGTMDLAVKWSYTGGYSSIPDGLVAIAKRLATFDYKLRNAPMQQAYNPILQMVEIPLAIPPDVKADLALWRRQLS